MLQLCSCSLTGCLHRLHTDTVLSPSRKTRITPSNWPWLPDPSPVQIFTGPVSLNPWSLAARSCYNEQGGSVFSGLSRGSQIWIWAERQLSAEPGIWFVLSSTRFYRSQRGQRKQMTNCCVLWMDIRYLTPLILWGCALLYTLLQQLNPSIHLSVHPSVHLSIYLSIYLSVCLQECDGVFAVLC